MADVNVIARLIHHGPTQFGVVVSTVVANSEDDAISTEIETADTETLARAEVLRQRLIGIVVGRAHRRGHNVLCVHRVTTFADKTQTTS